MTPQEIKRRRNQYWLGVLKIAVGCHNCGYTGDARALEFHHRADETKKFSISNRLGGKWRTLLREVAKCDVLCSNCHKIETWPAQIAKC
ncbi:MAG: hypothetical protein V3S83_12375 [Gemmatimonadota bacterium]